MWKIDQLCWDSNYGSLGPIDKQWVNQLNHAATLTQRSCFEYEKLFNKKHLSWPIWGQLKGLVPHSECSLKENPRFLQNFRPKNSTLRGNVLLLFSYNIYHSILGLTFKGKKNCFMSQNCVHFLRENFQNVRQNCKEALWMRHLDFGFGCRPAPSPSY
jgi:hypothetical protein